MSNLFPRIVALLMTPCFAVDASLAIVPRPPVHVTISLSEEALAARSPLMPAGMDIHAPAIILRLELLSTLSSPQRNQIMVLAQSFDGEKSHQTSLGRSFKDRWNLILDGWTRERDPTLRLWGVLSPENAIAGYAVARRHYFIEHFRLSQDYQDDRILVWMAIQVVRHLFQEQKLASVAWVSAADPRLIAALTRENLPFKSERADRLSIPNVAPWNHPVAPDENVFQASSEIPALRRIAEATIRQETLQNQLHQLKDSGVLLDSIAMIAGVSGEAVVKAYHGRGTTSQDMIVRLWAACDEIRTRRHAEDASQPVDRAQAIALLNRLDNATAREVRLTESIARRLRNDIAGIPQRGKKVTLDQVIALNIVLDRMESGRFPGRPRIKTESPVEKTVDAVQSLNTLGDIVRRVMKRRTLATAVLISHYLNLELADVTRSLETLVRMNILTSFSHAIGVIYSIHPGIKNMSRAMEILDLYPWDATPAQIQLLRRTA